MTDLAGRLTVGRSYPNTRGAAGTFANATDSHSAQPCASFSRHRLRRRGQRHAGRRTHKNFSQKHHLVVCAAALSPRPARASQQHGAADARRVAVEAHGAAAALGRRAR
eukprot:785386-Prymnesium_polylepis.1